MTAEATKPRIKITYATLRNDNEELHALYEQGVVEVPGRARCPPSELRRRPLGRRLGGASSRFARRSTATSSSGRSRRAIARTRSARSRRRVGPRRAWRHTSWEERLAILRRAAEFISERQMRYGADMAFEVGKNRLEALGEVEEAADLIRYYAQTAEDNNFYDHPLDNLGRRCRPHPLDPPAARRLRGHQPVQLPDGPRRRARSAPRSSPATPSSTSRRPPRRCPA